MRETSVTVRPAELHEDRMLSELAVRSKARWGYDETFMDEVRAELAVSRRQIAEDAVFVVEERGVVGGFYALHVEPPRAQLVALFIDPAAMGKGYGRLLWEHAVNEARALGAKQMTIDADPFAEPFYLAMGAERVGEVPSGSIPGRLLPLMRYDLA